MVEPPGAAPTVNAGIAVALSEMLCGDPATSSAIIKVAARCPVATGLNTTEIMQLAAGATGLLHVLLALNSEALEPPSETEDTCSGAFPVLVTVNVCAALEVPCVVAGNEGPAGEMLTPGPLETPVPVTTTVCGEFAASSVSVTVADRTPEAAGGNVTVTVQLEFTAIAEEHVGLEEL